MFTRQHLGTAYSSQQPSRVIEHGAVRLSIKDGIPQTWAISRPCSSPNPDRAPLYLNGLNRTRTGPNRIIRFQGFPLVPGRPHIEMDPSDPRTWRRQYRFT